MPEIYQYYYDKLKPAFNNRRIRLPEVHRMYEEAATNARQNPEASDLDTFWAVLNAIDPFFAQTYNRYIAQKESEDFAKRAQKLQMSELSIADLFVGLPVGMLETDD